MLQLSLGNPPLVEWTDKGLYCAVGEFYIDPTRSVETAVITHAHSDHARRGSKRYFCTSNGLGLLKCRLGQSIPAKGIPYGNVFQLGQVLVSFHSAGHILGSAQVRIQSGSEVWVVSGDYKRGFDPSCDPFEIVKCDTFVTEATFGTPKYSWPKNPTHGKDIFEWWSKNSNLGRNSVLFGYSLGKAQRILAELAPFANRPVLIHSSISKLSQCYREEGWRLAPTSELESLPPEQALRGELILAPPSILETDWTQRLGEFETAFASGWMQQSAGARANRDSPNYGYGSAYDHGFVMSDHADWNDLNQTIDDTGARQVFVLHRNGVLIRHLRSRGIKAHPAEALSAEKYIRNL